MVVIDDEPTSKRRDATWASRPENSVPTKLIRRPIFSAIARSSSLSNPVNWPAELMQMLGGASDSVPTVSTPGVPRPSVSTLTVLSGATVGVVYLSSPGPAAAEARLVGTALALSTPGGAHWSTSATAGAAIGTLNTSSPTSDRTMPYLSGP